jgi:pimeloyl-ACP methyl ester carboxylesterase
MATIHTNGIETYYETQGAGTPLVLIHGGFVDSRMWAPQIEHFANRFQVIHYDLRGHGKTGGSPTPKYSIDLFADDLKALLEALGLDRVILCGLSLGGMIAQSFAVRHTDWLKALILADTAVSVSLTWSDKLTRYVLAPKWLMLATIRWMSVPRFVDFSFKLAQRTRSSDWFGQDPETAEYVRHAMLSTSTAEYLKIYDAIYDFSLLNLAAINVPTLILNGEYESKTVFQHTRKMLELIPQSEAHVIPAAGHTSNMENAAAFNQQVDQFLMKVIAPPTPG